MFSDYQAPGREAREPYVYQPNQYPFAHIHATNSAVASPNAKPAHRAVSMKKKITSTAQLNAPDAVFVRPQTGPAKQQALGHGPFHSTSARPDQRRFDFSKPRAVAGRPLSVLDERAVRDQVAANELNPQDTIRLFTSSQRHVQEAAQLARGFRQSAPNYAYVQSENNDPLSNHANISLEKFALDGHQALGGQLNGASQPQISARFIQKQTELRLQSKAQQLEQYHRDVQARLNKRVAEQKAREEARKAQLPHSVKKLVYDIHTPQTETPASEQAEPIPPSTGNVELDHGLKRMHLMPYHETMAPQQQQQPSHAEAASAAPASAAASMHAWGEASQQSVSGGGAGGGSSTARARADKLALSREKRLDLLSKEELAAFRFKVKKQEIEWARQQIRSNPASASGGFESSRGRPQERVAFGHTMSRTPSPAGAPPPRPIPRGAICGAEERDDLHRNPRSFVVRQHTVEDEEEEDETVLHVPLAVQAARNKKTNMSAAVAGRRGGLPKKKKSAVKDAVQDGVSGAEKNAAYRRLLLERLHNIALTLQHPLPPLCACGFTPAEEYELLFSYAGSAPGSALAHVHQQTAAAAAQAQPAFNLSTMIAAPAASTHSIHHHSHAHQAATQASAAALPSHVSVDASRHAFQHKVNCTFYNNPDAYIKALANLLHTLEDQQQI
jgi:hypothetical protein